MSALARRTSLGSFGISFKNSSIDFIFSRITLISFSPPPYLIKAPPAVVSFLLIVASSRISLAASAIPRAASSFMFSPSASSFAEAASLARFSSLLSDWMAHLYASAITRIACEAVAMKFFKISICLLLPPVVLSVSS